MKSLKKNVGITIVSLIITIVIILMLAGVAVAAIKNTGLFDKTEMASLANIKSTSSEKVKLALMSLQEGAAEENKNVTLQLIHDGLPQEDNKISMYDYTNEDKVVKGVYDYDSRHEYEFSIDENGNVILGEVAELNKFKIATSNVTTKSVDVSIENALSKGIEGAKYTYVAQTEDGKQVTVTDTAKSKTIYGLTAGTKYQVYVLAKLSNGKLYKSTVENIETEGMPDVKLVKGAIDFSGITWNNKKANISISTNTKYKIQYQVNSTNGTWTDGSTGSGTTTTVNNLIHEDVVYARLTDEVNVTGYTSIQIKDKVKPDVTLEKGSITTRSITVKASADDNYKMPDTPTYTFFLDGEQKQSNSSDTCTFDGLTANKDYTVSVSVNDEVGNTGTTELQVKTGEMPKDEDVKDLTKGKISFSDITWNNQKASITLSTDTNYTIQYQVNGIDGNWTSASKAGESITVSGLVHNDMVYARLTDGVNNTGYTSTIIKDSIKPDVTLAQNSISTRAVTVTAGATDNAGMPSSPTYTFYLKEGSGSYEQKQSSSSTSCTIDGLKANTAYTVKVAVKDAVGNEGTKELSITTGAMPSDADVKNLNSGKLTFSGITWANQKASVTMSTSTKFTIQYQVNSYTGSWTDGTTASGLVHGNTVYARLSDGVNATGYTSMYIEDKIAPTVTLAQNSISTRAVTVTAGATDNAGMPSSPTYTFYLKEGSGSYEQKQSSSSTSCTIDGLKANTAYTVKVAVKDAVGNEGTKELSITTGAMPSDADVKNLNSGKLTFSGITWANQKASVTMSTSTKFTIQYQVNSYTGSWTDGTTASGLVHGNTVYARLSDGVNATGYTSMYIEDKIAPTVTLTQNSLSTRAVKVTASATDNAGMPSSPTYTFYLKEGSGSYSQKQSSTNASYTADGLKAHTSYTIKAETKDSAGNTGYAEKTITTGSMPSDTEVASGKITFTNLVWSNQKASININTDTSYTIQYQVGSTSGTWTSASSAGATVTATGLVHNNKVYARLTDGVNYTGYTMSTIIDSIAPTVTVSSTVTTKSITFTANATDNYSMQSSPTYVFYIDGSSTAAQSGTSKTYTLGNLDAGTKHTAVVKVKDAVGNEGSGSGSGTTSSMPTGAITMSTSNGNNWTNQNVTVTAATSQSGYTMQMKIGDGSWTSTSSVSISSNCTVYARLTDGRNYTGTASITESRIDKTAPTISSFTAGTVTTSTIPVTVSASDSGGSGISNYKFYLGSELKATQTTSSYTYEGLTAGTSYTLKVVVTDNAGNSKDSSTTASTQQLGIADAISKGIKVGDTVTYTPPTASYTVAKANSGYTSDQTFDSSNSAMNLWKVWKINSNSIEIVSASATRTKLDLTGATGYNQGPGIMNNICKALYSRSNDITARSLDGQDIEEAMAENWGTTRGSDAFNTKLKGYSSNYGTTYTPSSNLVPDCYTTENIISQQNNDLRPGSSSATGYTQRSGFTCKSTYYNVSSSNMSDAVGSLRATILGTRDSWLASRCVVAWSYLAYFIIRSLDIGNMNNYYLFLSYNDSYTLSFGLSPLASLGSSVQLQKLDDNIWKVQ